MTVAATIKLLGAAEFKKSIDGMGTTVAKMNKTAMDPKALRSMSKETTTLKKQMESFKGTVSKTDPALAKVRNELAANMRTLRSAGVDVRKLDGDFKRLNTTQNTARNNWAKFGSAMKTSGAVIGGAVVGGVVLGAAIKPQMVWDKQMDDFVRTALPKGTDAEHTDMKNMLNEAINEAGKLGGDRDSIAQSLSTMIASGKMNPQEAASFLPWLNKAAVASGADPVALANIVRILADHGMAGEENYKKALNMALAAGQAGSFELKDLAKHLPDIMSSAQRAGASGFSGFLNTLSALEAGMLTAGSTDEAATNIGAMFTAIASSELKKRLSKEYNIDMDKLALDAINRGENPVVAVIGMMQQIAEKDKRYRQLKADLASAKNAGERGEIMQAAASWMEGSVIGTLFSEKRAVAGLAGFGNRKYVAEVEKTIIEGENDAVDHGFSRVEKSAWRLAEATANELGATKARAYDGIETTLSSVLGKINAYADVYPGLTTALYGATEVVKALVVAGVAGGLMRSGLGGFGAGKVAQSLGVGAAGAGAAQVATASRFGSAVRSVGGLTRAAMADLAVPVTIATISTYGAVKAIDAINRYRGIDPDAMRAEGARKENLVARARALSDSNRDYRNMKTLSPVAVAMLSAPNLERYKSSLMGKALYYHGEANNGFGAMGAGHRASAAIYRDNALLALDTLEGNSPLDKLLAGWQDTIRGALAPIETMQQKPAPPQINDNSQRTIQVNLGVIDPTQLVPLVKRTIEEQLVAEKNNRRGDQFDTMEAIG